MNTTTAPKPTSFIAAMKHFFGFKPNQTLQEFSAEIKVLTPADKEYFAQGLRQNGYDIPTGMATGA